MRLIDADALKEDIEQQCALLRLTKDNDELNQISMVLESGFVAHIDKMPTIEERKKGKWINKDGGLATCSACGDRWGVWSVMNYCPNCGADMRKEIDDEDNGQI